MSPCILLVKVRSKNMRIAPEIFVGKFFIWDKVQSLLASANAKQSVPSPCGAVKTAME